MVKGDTNTTKTEDNVVFFAGTSATNTSNLNTKEAKTYITEGGKLHSQEAEIIGDVTAKSLTVSSEGSSTQPNIIFTTYNDDVDVNTYDSNGNKVSSVKMSTFNNVKDSNGSALEKGSPIGIVYKLSNNQYVPTYFFDFAPLIVKGYTQISFYTSPWGSTISLFQDTDTKKVYYGSTDNPIPYSNDVYLPFSGYAFEYNKSSGKNILHSMSGYRNINIKDGVIDYTTKAVQIRFNKQLTYTSYKAQDINITNGNYDLFTVESSPTIYGGVTSVNNSIHIKSSSGYPTSKDKYTVQEFMANNYGLVPYIQQAGDDIPETLKNKTLYMAVPLALGGIRAEVPLYHQDLEDKVYVLDQNYITTTNDTIMSFNVENTSTDIFNNNLSGILYLGTPSDNTALDTDVCKGITVTGHDKDLNNIIIG